MLGRALVAVTLASLFAGTSAGVTYVILPDGTGDFPTIQAGFYAVADGDTILLEDGVFTGGGNYDIDTSGKEVLLRSMSGDPASCIIDCQGMERGFDIDDGETAALVLQGLSIVNASTVHTGAGVHIFASSPTFIDCIIQGNQSTWIGGGVQVASYSAPSFVDCLFVGNSSIESYGGAIAFEGDSLHLEGCVFMDNSASGGGALNCSGGVVRANGCVFSGNHASNRGGAVRGSPVVISNSEFLGNTADWGAGIISTDCMVTDCTFGGNEALVGGAGADCGGGYQRFSDCLFVSNVSPWSAALNFRNTTGEVDGCTFYGNSSSEEAAGMYSYDNASVAVTNSIIAFSTDGEAARVAPGSVLTFSCCDLYGNHDGDWAFEIEGQFGINGNISENPLFCDAPNSDFGLHENSPCAPFTPPNPECDLIGARPVGCAAQDVVLPPLLVAPPMAVIAQPNPFTRSTGIRLVHPSAGISDACLAIYDVAGRLVQSFDVNGLRKGTGTLTWDGTNADDDPVPSGMYLLRLTAGDVTSTTRLVKLR